LFSVIGNLGNHKKATHFLTWSAATAFPSTASLTGNSNASSQKKMEQKEVKNNLKKTGALNMIEK